MARPGQMLDITLRELAWSAELMPVGEGDLEKEGFDAWWARNRVRLSHLEPRIAEQLVHRHWRHSPYCFLDLDRLTWRLERWSSARIIDDVYMPGWDLDPEFDYDAFNRNNRFGGHPTSRPMNATGTWDYPIVLLETPNGVRDRPEERPDVRFLLIEGHSRRRYLNALMARCLAQPDHEVFVMSYRDSD